MIVWCTLMQCACEQNVDGMGKIIHYSREDFCVINMVVMYEDSLPRKVTVVTNSHIRAFSCKVTWPLAVVAQIALAGT